MWLHQCRHLLHEADILKSQGRQIVFAGDDEKGFSQDFLGREISIIPPLQYQPSRAVERSCLASPLKFEVTCYTLDPRSILQY